LTDAHTIIDIDPYHYRGYLEEHFAYRGLQRLREAELAVLRAIQLATPVQQPDAYDAMARFKLNLKAPADAATFAQKALNVASPYIPATYSTRWEADTLVVLGRAQFAQGDRAGAEQTAKRASELDPFNGTLAIFRFTLNPPPP
jgi:tetratricopeptide (TPR) repeat protein